jgi:tripartite-type tricarboxylate transporter receptor subunit TctC
MAERAKRGSSFHIHPSSFGFLLLVVSLSAVAQGFPVKPIRIVVPYPPGGATDTAVRVYADGMTPLLGQQIVVEYRAGGGTNIGAAFVAQSPPDGYTRRTSPPTR